MIIDAHGHLLRRETHTEGWWDGWVNLGKALSGRSEEEIRKRLPELWDSGTERMIEAMDEAGIDKTVLIGVDWGLATPVWGEREVGWEERNGQVREALEARPDRFIGVFGVDPRRENAVELLEMAVKEWGMKGLKIHPAAGFYVNDKVVYKLYEKAVELGIPVYVHTGPEASLPSRHGRPIYVDDVAVDFPSLNIVIAHAGLFPWWGEAAGIASMRPNLFLDLAGWQPWMRRRPLEFYRALRTIIDLVGPYRVMFGSDWPILKLNMSNARWLKAFQEPPDPVKEAGLGLTDREKALILGENAGRLFGL